METGLLEAGLLSVGVGVGHGGALHELHELLAESECQNEEHQ